MPPQLKKARALFFIEHLPCRKIIKELQPLGLSTDSLHAISQQANQSQIIHEDDYMHFVLRIPILGQDTVKFFAIHFIMNKEWFVCIPLHSNSPLRSTLKKAKIVDHSTSGDYFIEVIRRLYQHIEIDLYSIDHEIGVLEEKIFRGAQSKLIKDATLVNRKIIDIEQSIRFHELVFNYIKKEEEFAYLHETCGVVLHFYQKNSLVLLGHKDTVFELQKSLDMLVTSRTNQTTKTLTIAAFAILPVTTAMQALSMNTSSATLNNISNEGVAIVLSTAVFFSLAVIAYLYGRRLL